ncbi:MAG: diguanylate cyclase [Acidiferrobacterales bacterium]
MTPEKLVSRPMRDSDNTILEGGTTPTRASAPTRPCLTVLQGGPVGLVYTLPTGMETLIGRGDEADLPLEERYVSRKHAVIKVSPKGKALIEDQGSSNGTFVNGVAVHRQEIKEGDRIQIGYSCIIKFSYQDDLEYQLQQEVASGFRDPLTGLYTKMYFQDRLDAEFTDTHRHDEHLGVLMFAIDHFKDIMIHHDQAACDLIVKEVACMVSQVLRAGDVFARYDEELLAVLARRLDDKGSVILARRIRKIVQGHQFDFDGAPVQLTVSIGIATLSDKPKKAAKLINIAEKSLRKTQKRTGQNGIGGAAVMKYLQNTDVSETICYVPNKEA